MRKHSANYFAQCQHSHCTDCATRRGNKIGIRRIRHLIKRALRVELKESR